MQPTKPASSVVSTTGQIDTAAAAKNPYGNLEVTKFLYESGLQNIFNTYQQNIASLDQNKQSELQDAYYIREMSKKYLGEYASNVGIGDVSGNLLDIYGQYQNNITDIERNYDQLQMGLDQQYQSTRQETMNNLLVTQYNIDVAKLEQADKKVIFDIEMGNTPEGMTDMEYLEQEFQAGRISESSYQQASLNLMENQRTAEERQIFGQLVRGEMSKEELTEAYRAGTISEAAYAQYFNVMEQQERTDVLNNVEFNIQQNQMDGLNTRQYLQKQLTDEVITRGEYEQLVTKYAGDPRAEVANEVSFNILNGTLPEGFEDAKAYIQANKDALGEENYRSLMLSQTIKERGVEAFSLYEKILSGNLPEGTTVAEAISQGVEDGLFTLEQAAELYSDASKRQQEKAVSDVEFAIAMGQTGGLSNEDFIQQEYAEGRLTYPQYQALILEEKNAQNIKDAINYNVDLFSGNYGDMSVEEFIDFGIESGFLSPEVATTFLLQERTEQQQQVFTEVIEEVTSSETPEEVLEQSVEEGKITQEEADAIQKQLDLEIQSTIQSFQTTFGIDDATYAGVDERGRTVIKDNPYASAVLQLGIEDFSYFIDDPNITADTQLQLFSMGNVPPALYSVATESAPFDIKDIEEFYDDDIILVPGEIYEYYGSYYKFENDEFFKLTETNFDPNQLNELQKLIESGKFNFSKQTAQYFGDNWEYNSNGDERDTLTYNGVEYIEDTNSNSWDYNATDKEEKDVVLEFQRIYGINPRDPKAQGTKQIIFYKGSFYIRDARGKYQKMIKA
jgi:hypothetical protein